MAKKRRDPNSLVDAKRYYQILLWEATQGAMGESLETTQKKNNSITFAEKRGLLDSILKIATLDKKDQEDDTGDSFFDVMKKRNQSSGGKTDKRARADDTPTDGDDDGAPPGGLAALKDDWRT